MCVFWVENYCIDRSIELNLKPLKTGLQIVCRILQVKCTILKFQQNLSKGGTTPKTIFPGHTKAM